MLKLSVEYKKFLTKPMWVMLISVAVLFGFLFCWKGVNAYLIQRQMRYMVQPDIPVSTTKVHFSMWQPMLKAVGTLRAVIGINVTTELPGLVQKIYFSPGTSTREGALLIQINADTEMAQLQAAKAEVELAKMTYERDKLQFKAHGVSKQQVEADFWTLKKSQAQAQVAKTNVRKKSIHAPFSGRLGISQVSFGQYVKPGDILITLQTFNPIYIDFYLPQQALRYVRLEQSVIVTSDVFPKQQFLGKISTIEPHIDSKTSTVKIEATIHNPTLALIPGMYAAIEIKAQKPRRHLTLPQSAVSFDSYGEFVFLVKKKAIKNKPPQFFVKQIYITTGAMRGNEIAIKSGLNEGDTVVTGGQLKLKNGSLIKIHDRAV